MFNWIFHFNVSVGTRGKDGLHDFFNFSELQYVLVNVGFEAM